MANPATVKIGTFASSPHGVGATLTNIGARNVASGNIFIFSSVPFGVTANDSITYDIQTGNITVALPSFFSADLIQEPRGVVLDGVGGGWIKTRRKPRKELTETRAAKIRAKRERRQEYVMRKILNELRGIDLEDDPELQALIAEFETPDEVLKSAEEIQAMLNEAYMKYIVEREMRIAEQDKQDEDEIMALLSLTL